MANPLPNEKELFQKIRNENISIHPLIWDTMYHFLGDYVSAINFISLWYIEKNEAMTISDGRRILEYTKKIIEAVGKILHPERIKEDEGAFRQIKEDNIKLHPLIHEFFTHYISNDTNCINFRVSYYLDPIDEQPIPVDEVKKILDYTASMRRFLDRLREATSKETGF